MFAILLIIAPLFGVIACGYIVGRTRLISDEGIRGLTTFVFYVAIPLLLVRTVGRNELPSVGELGILFAYYGGCMLMFVSANLIGRLVFKLSIGEGAVMGMGTMYSNIILLGLPLVHAIYGDAGMLPMTLIASFPTILLVPPVIFMIEIGRGGRGNLSRLLWTSVTSTLRNPIILGMAAGIFLSLTGIKLPGVIDRFVTLVASGAPSCALFAVGASLAQGRIAGNLVESFTITFLKLCVMPVVVWLLASRVVGLDSMWTTVATVTAALPSGANVFITARTFDTYAARACSATIISTALSVVTLTILLAMLGAR